VTHGITQEQRDRIGDLPRGHGILGAIIDRPVPLRLDHLGRSELSYGFPPNHPPMETFLGVPILIRDKAFGTLYLTEKKGGGSFTDQDEQIVIALAAAAGVVIENARLYDEAARRQRWLEAAAEITAALMGTASQLYALQLVADRAREVASADLSAVLLRQDGDELLVAVVSGVPAGAAIGSSVPSMSSLSDEVVTSGERIVLEDYRADPRVSGPIGSEAGWPKLGPLMLLPLRTSYAVDGVLVMAWAPENRDRFHDTDVRLPTTFAEQAALALQVVRAREDQALLAVFEDRDRIGRDLHDLVIQRLFAVGLTLENASRLAVRPEVSTRISAAVDDIDATIKDIRQTIFGLSAPAETTDLRAQISETVTALLPSLGFAPTVHLNGPIDSGVSEEVRPHLLAVLREALSNVGRHASASTAEVSLDVGSDVTLTVRDDGTGIGDTTRQSGLRNLRERAQQLGGTFDVRPGETGGTVVTWQVPAR
jgi:signal transduction histidine kinase